ncbi:hypothetical protein BU23DRAFT_560828 [Bimuria novae-zelandiae CBS 107.79]|uniref:Uncharacterized protein n=1 Tax=Bimuria novae-zelandiae CBS 107.79 TaxID=1447943 RepID=A0A6A5UXK5_9PLEO|nr:hypothetical protein BU23DRAFT_560828 [Bimuria novae-zelandiae CBS 107.79]
MKPHLNFAMMVILIAQLVSGSFDIYYLKRNTKGSPTEGWQVLDASQKSCPDLHTTRLFPKRRDVSGNKIGVRCDGKGCWSGAAGGGDPSDIDILEMHFSNTPQLHWTIYRLGHPGEPWTMFAAGTGLAVGKCTPSYEDDSWFQNCGEWSGHARMRCSMYFSADFINSHDRGW